MIRDPQAESPAQPFGKALTEQGHPLGSQSRPAGRSSPGGEAPGLVAAKPHEDEIRKSVSHVHKIPQTHAVPTDKRGCACPGTKRVIRQGPRLLAPEC